MRTLGRRCGLRLCPKYCGAAALVAVVTLWPGSAEAQTSDTIRGFLRELFVTTPTPAEISSGLAAIVLENATRFPEETAKLVGLGVFTLPIGSSSAGFAYSVDPRTGESMLKSQSFGPLFAERPLTSGKGVWNVAFNYQRTKFDHLNGIDVADHGENSKDEGLFVFDNGAVWPNPTYVQFLTERAFFEATTNSFNFFLTYGVIDNLDIGVVLPFVSVKAAGRRQLFWDLTRSFQDDPVGSALDFPEGPIGVRDRIARRTFEASGIGDILLRAKFSPLQRPGSAFGVAVDLRLPTGDEDNLLGTGKASGRFLALGSTAVGSRTSVYGNAGYTAGGQSDEVNYVGGVDVALGSRKQLTVAASLIGQVVQDGIGFDTLRTFDRVGTTGIRVTFDRQIVSTDTLHVMNAAVGAKFHLTGRWLLTGSVLFPLNDAGFRGGATPIIGLDHTWTPKRR